MSEDRSIFHEEEMRSKPRSNAAPVPEPEFTLDKHAERITRCLPTCTAPAPSPAPAPQPTPQPAPQPRPARGRSSSRRHTDPRKAICAIAVIAVIAIILTIVLPKFIGSKAMGSELESAVAAKPALVVAPTAEPTAKPAVVVAPTAEPQYIYVTVEATPRIIYVTPEPTTAPAGIVRATGDVYIRTGPARSYDIAGVMKNGSQATYLGECRLDERGVAWYSIRRSGCTGWVSSRYSQLE